MVTFPMILYYSEENDIGDIKIYRDSDDMPYIQSSLGVNSAVLFRKINIRDDGAVLFYGETYRECEIEIEQGDPPPRVYRYG